MAAFRKKFSEKVVDKLADKAVEGICAVVALVVGTGLWTDAISTGFYHPGWSQERRSWTFLFYAAFLVATALTISRIGFAVVGVLTLMSAAAFGFLYGNPSYQHADWPLVGWLAHGLCIALALGFLVGLVGRVWRWLVR